MFTEAHTAYVPKLNHFTSIFNTLNNNVYLDISFAKPTEQLRRIEISSADI